jgi:hypothetical protein
MRVRASDLGLLALLLVSSWAPAAWSATGCAESPNFTIVDMTPGDVDGDGHVDVVDLLWLVDAFGSVTGDASFNWACDFNDDGSVDVVDLLIMVENWGV